MPTPSATLIFYVIALYRCVTNILAVIVLLSSAPSLTILNIVDHGPRWSYRRNYSPDNTLEAG